MKNNWSSFKKYYELLIASNENFNLTAITELKSVLAYHFSDSLALAKAFDMSKISALADIGTGAGFPGIPLKLSIHICMWCLWK